MGIFDRFFGRSKKAEAPRPPRAVDLQEQAARERQESASRLVEEELHDRQTERNAEAKKWFDKGFLSSRAKSKYPSHTDASFNDDELAALLLGLTVPCRSTWIASAFWDEEPKILWLEIGGKYYHFPDMDYDKVVEFAMASSKGSDWFWTVWKGKYGRTQPMGVEWTAGLPTGQAHRVR